MSRCQPRVYQAAVNDQAGSRSHTHYSQTEITTHHTKYQNKVQLWKNRQNQRTISFERAKRNISRGVSQIVYQAAVNDQAGSRSHTRYSQTEITTHHTKYQNKVQLWKKRQNQRTISFERAKRNTRRGVSQGVYQSAVNDQAGSRSHIHYSQTEITTHHMEYQNKVQLWKKRQNQRAISFERAKRNTRRGVSQGVYQSAVNDQAGSRSHIHYSQTEITTHHMEYQKKVQLWKKRQNQRTISFERAKRNTRRGVSQGVYQSAVNDQAGSRSHTHYSQTEITTHHMEYQNKLQL